MDTNVGKRHRRAGWRWLVLTVLLLLVLAGGGWLLSRVPAVQQQVTSWLGLNDPTDVPAPVKPQCEAGLGSMVVVTGTYGIGPIHQGVPGIGGSLPAPQQLGRHNPQSLVSFEAFLSVSTIPYGQSSAEHYFTCYGLKVFPPAPGVVSELREVQGTTNQVESALHIRIYDYSARSAKPCTLKPSLLEQIKRWLSGDRRSLCSKSLAPVSYASPTLAKVPASLGIHRIDTPSHDMEQSQPQPF